MTPRPLLLTLSSICLSLFLLTGTLVASSCGKGDSDCHPAYEPCIPNCPGDALNCDQIDDSLKPVIVKEVGIDPYWLDADRNGIGCVVEAKDVVEQLFGNIN